MNLWLPFLLAASIPSQRVDPADIDAVMRDALASWHVPGAALAIVHDDRVIYLKGFGVRELGKSEPVTADTIFPLASCTKPFTSLALAMLVDEGKLRWDDPVRKHVPFFRLADPLADAQVTLRDLLCHRTGLGSHELLWYRAPWSLEERIRKIALLEPSHSFRAKLQYQSILFGTAGYAAGKASGSAWPELMQKRIFDVLDMKSASVITSQALKSPDHASPHKRAADGKVVVIPWYTITEPDPAGSINASARDLAKFVRFQLGDGRWQGRQHVSAEQLAETHAPQIVVRLEGFARVMNPDTGQLSYGLGWVVQDYRGQHLLMHGGVIDGFRAHFTLVPKRKLGFVLLNNLDRTQMNLAVSNALVDLFCGLPYRDWNAYYQKIQEAEAEQAQRAKAKRLEQKHSGTKPSRPLQAYAGVYEDRAYGPCRISVDKGRLVWQWSNFHLPLEHWHYDTFRVSSDVFIDAAFVFALGTDGEVASLRAMDREFKRKR